MNFKEWISTAKPGESFVYFRGFLGDSITPPSGAEKAEAEAVFCAFGRGVVEIAQRRVAPSIGKKPGAFEYIAQRRKETRPPTVYGGPWLSKLQGPYAS